MYLIIINWVFNYNVITILFIDAPNKKILFVLFGVGIGGKIDIII